jgi:hypothetical protein
VHTPHDGKLRKKRQTPAREVRYRHRLEELITLLLSLSKETKSK